MYFVLLIFTVGCAGDVDCPSTKACVNSECVDPCSAPDSPCAPSATCTVAQHKPQCVCPLGQHGDPMLQCIVLGCRTSDQCPSSHACVNQQCRNHCETNVCGVGAKCAARAHNYTCSCPAGHSGDPYVACRQPETKVCVVDHDCGVGLVCVGGVCANPCEQERPCAPNAVCIVKDSRPLKSVTCTCPPGFTGNAQIQCRKSMEHVYSLSHISIIHFSSSTILPILSILVM